MLGSKFLDLVMGVDIHIQLVPAPPSPVPVPALLPSPFIGMVFDPVTAAAMVLGPCPLVTAIAVAMDPIGFVVNMAIDKLEGVNGDQVLINGLVASTTMTEPANRWVSPHTPTPPAILFFNSGKPVPVLMGNAVYNLGSSSVWINSRRAVRAFIDPAFTCSEPLRLPTGMTLPIPLGAPVIIGGFPCPDIQAMISRAARSAISGAIKAAVNRPLTAAIRLLPPGRLRTVLATAKCHCTGDPVDVATGRMFSTATDWELPGPIPLKFTREYSSAVSDRDGVLGYGWSHALDEEVWLERGRVVYRAGDGREIQFDTVHLRERKIGVGDELFEPVNRLWLRCMRDGFDVRNAEGRVHELRRVKGDRCPDRWRLVRIRSRDLHEIALDYDEYGRLAWVRDSEGRMLRFEHNRADRLIRISLPHPTVPGFVPHVSYEYSESGNLVAVRDALGNVSRYDYSGHLMVQRTDRTGLSFYFGYDGIDSTAYCVRTWGDGGIYDHELVYDKEGRRTFVTNSVGATTVYTMNEALLVEKVTDAHGGTTEYAYDAQLRMVKEVGPSSETAEFEYDALGNCVRVVYPGGAERKFEYDEHNLRVRSVDALGAMHRLDYDGYGRLVGSVDPMGGTTTIEYHRGRISAVFDATGQATRITYDEVQRIETVTLPRGGTLRRRFDALGRVTEEEDARGATTKFRYSPHGDVVGVLDARGSRREYVYDGERNLLESRDDAGSIRLTYGGFHRVVTREIAGSRINLEYDTEDRLVCVVNEAGERYRYELDALGRVASEATFDGGVRTYARDRSGRITAVRLPSGRTSKRTYDPAGRLIEVTNSDGTFARFEFDVVGQLLAAENETTRVELERDVLGRVLVQRANGVEVRSTYDKDGERIAMRTSLGASTVVQRNAEGGVDFVTFGANQRVPAEAPVRFFRTPDGLESSRQFANGIVVEWDRDIDGRPLARRTLRRSGATSPTSVSPFVAGASPRGSEIEARTYQWQEVDRLTAIFDAATGPRFFDHDPRGRLIRERRATGTIDRAMDAVGNVYRSASGTDRRYAEGGRLTNADGFEYEYDADGNQIRKSGPEGTWRYVWNGHGMLREVKRPDGSKVEYGYDAFARRVSKRVVGYSGASMHETTFTWDGHLVVHEVDSQQGLTTWEWEPDSLAPIGKEQGGRRWSIIVDHLGTPTEMYNDLGELAWKMQLDVFGVPTFEVGAPEDCPFRWPGQYADADVGDHYNGWRWYSPSRGSYHSQDPLGLDGGTNLYGYVQDPLVQLDPFGQEPIPLDQLGWSLYHITNQQGDVVYVGITRSPVTREAQHAESGRLALSYEMHEVETNLTYAQARGYEQADIERHGTRDTGRRGRPIQPGESNRCWSYDPRRTDYRAAAYRLHEEERRRALGGCGH